MTSAKKPMSNSYKAIFAFSLFMILFVFIGQATDASKRNGSGILYWGYTAWLMYRRNNKALFYLQKVMLWFLVLVFLFCAITFSESDFLVYMGLSRSIFLITALFALGLTYSLYKYFKSQLESKPLNNNGSSGPLAEDKYWDQASRELEGDRHEATWAKALVTADGDQTKAKAIYLKNRVYNLQFGNSFPPVSNNLNQDIPDTGAIKSPVVSLKKRKLSKKLGLFIISAILLLPSFYEGYNKYVKPSVSGKSKTETIISSFKEEDHLCYVYWDGVRWKLGKTEGDDFTRLRRSRYGVEVVEMAIPRSMASEYKLQSRTAVLGNNPIYSDFIDKYWYQVEGLCGFT